MILPHNLRRKPTLFCSRPTLIRDSTFPATWTKCPRPSNWQTWEEERPKGGEGNQCELRNGKWRAQRDKRARRGEPTCRRHPPRSGRLLRLPHIRGSIKRREVFARIPRHWQFANFLPTSFSAAMARKDSRWSHKSNRAPSIHILCGMSDNLGIPNDCG